MTSLETAQLEAALDDRRPAARADALRRLKAAADRGDVPVAPRSPFMNLHCHTFHSFNAYGWSPSRVAWTGYRNGFSMMGVVDFDVLDALEEFREANRVLGARGIAGLESRVFVSHYARAEINSPNEPGVAYFVALGFRTRPAAGSPADAVLKKLAAVARGRNEAVVERLNGHLAPLRLDYDRDVLPLTIAGNATERHILTACYEKSAALFPDDARRAAFWAEKLAAPADEIRASFADAWKLYERMRSKLIKWGGVAYVAPDPARFPSLDDLLALARDGGGLPSYPFLDGTSAAESDIESLLAHFRDRGVRVITVIPDRNHNLRDAAEKSRKVANLRRFMAACRSLDLLVVAGTELNKAGQKIVDDFAAPELAPYLDDFVRGAEFVYAHAEGEPACTPT